MKWIGQNIYDQISKFRNTVDFSEDVTFYQPVNDGNPTVSLGSSATNRFEIKSTYNSGTQTLLSVDLKSYTSSSTANDGKFRFFVDEVQVGNFRDDGLFLNTSKSLTIGSGNAIISDSSGTTTLSNIDALDATTISTFNAALTAGDITGVAAGTGLSGGGISGAVTLNVEASQTQITAVGTIGTGVWQGTAIGASYVSTLNQDTTGRAATVATIAGLAPNTATTQATQAAITTCANLATVGTIGTGVWEGTAIASDQQKHLMHYQTIGYGTPDGTNYDISRNMATNTAPFNHDVSIGADGLTAQTPQTWLRSGGHVMPKACTLKRWTGWAASAGSGTTYLGLFKVTMTRNSSTTVSAVLLEEFSFTALGNTKNEDFDETSFTETAIAAGDILVTAIKGVSGKITYFNASFEVEF